MQPRPWTPQEVEDLRRITRRTNKKRCLDWKAIAKRFPDRSRAAIYKQMHIHGMCNSLAWSAEEDRVLRDRWGEVTMVTLRKSLPGRTRNGIYERAQKLGLKAGVPQGLVSVKSLSEDPSWGYDYYKTLKILEAHGARVRAFSYAGKGVGGVKCVDPHDAREAAEAWEKRIADERVGKETPKEAAKRLGVREETMRGWLTLEGLMPPVSGSTKRRFFAPPDVFDRVYGKYRVSRRKRCESPQTGAR
jgi:hypothetical protein